MWTTEGSEQIWVHLTQLLDSVLSRVVTLESWFVPRSMIKSNLNVSMWLVYKLNVLESKKLLGGHSSVVERLVANEKVEGSTPFARSIY